MQRGAHPPRQCPLSMGGPAGKTFPGPCGLILGVDAGLAGVCVSQTGRVPVHADLSEALYRAETATWLLNVVVLWEKIQTELVEVRDGRVV